MKKIALVLFLASGLVGCAHHKDVRPGESGIHRVLVTAEDGETGARNAISQANHFCKEQNKSAAFIDEKKDYKGSMAESDYKTAKTIAKIAQGVGGMGYVLGGKHEKDAGAVIGLGGGVASGVIGKGYSVDMKFKCL